MHHLVTDGVSWRILLADLTAACRAVLAGRPPEAAWPQAPQASPPGTSYRQWARLLTEHVRSGALDADLAYWTAQLAAAPPGLPPGRAATRDTTGDTPATWDTDATATWDTGTGTAATGTAATGTAAGTTTADATGTAVPASPPGTAANTVGGQATVTARLGPADTDALLRQVPAAYRTQVTDILLSALGAALTRWAGRDRILIALEGHGREDIPGGADLSQAIGWFTTEYPLALHIPAGPGPVPGPAGPAPDWDTILKSVKEQVRAIPSRGLSYGALRYLSDPGSPAAALSAAHQQHPRRRSASTTTAPWTGPPPTTTPCSDRPATRSARTATRPPSARTCWRSPVPSPADSSNWPGPTRPPATTRPPWPRSRRT